MIAGPGSGVPGLAYLNAAVLFQRQNVIIGVLGVLIDVLVLENDT